MAKQPPEKVFRIGSVSASVFVNEVKADNGTRTMRNVTLRCRFGAHSRGRNFGRFTDCFNTASCCRRARFSTARRARAERAGEQKEQHDHPINGIAAHRHRRP